MKLQVEAMEGMVLQGLPLPPAEYPPNIVVCTYNHRDYLLCLSPARKLVVPAALAHIVFGVPGECGYSLMGQGLLPVESLLYSTEHGDAAWALEEQTKYLITVRLLCESCVWLPCAPAAPAYHPCAASCEQPQAGQARACVVNG